MPCSLGIKPPATTLTVHMLCGYICNPVHCKLYLGDCRLWLTNIRVICRDSTALFAPTASIKAASCATSASVSCTQDATSPSSCTPANVPSFSNTSTRSLIRCMASGNVTNEDVTIAAGNIWGILAEPKLVDMGMGVGKGVGKGVGVGVWVGKAVGRGNVA